MGLEGKIASPFPTVVVGEVCSIRFRDNQTHLHASRASREDRWFGLLTRCQASIQTKRFPLALALYVDIIDIPQQDSLHCRPTKPSNTMKRPLCIFVAPVLLTGCSIAFPLLGDTSEDVNHVEFMQSLKTKADVLAAFQMPDTAREFHAEGEVFATWAYAAPPNGNYIGAVPFETPVSRRYRPGGDPTYAPPTIEDLQSDEFDIRGGLVIEFEGDSVTCWHSHNLDFSDNSKRNRLTVYGSLIDLGLMFLAGAMR